MTRLKAQRALDDGRFAEAFARSRLRHRGLGQRRIASELHHRGVARAVVQKGLGEALSGRLRGRRPRGPGSPLLACPDEGRAEGPRPQALGLPPAPGLSRRPREKAPSCALAEVERCPGRTRARGGRIVSAVLSADALRSAFLAFFEARGHRVVKSSSLVPESDPTLLFANAGMNQFKDVFLGSEKRDYVRATSSQKCVRAGGKHNDLENVGVTARHHTFFEMLGNFSFGDYFKKDAIAFAWELLTKDFGLPKDRLKVTIFHGSGRRAPRRRGPRLLARACGQRPHPRARHEGQLLGHGRDRPLRPLLGGPLPPGRLPALSRGGRRPDVPRVSSASATAGSRSGTSSSCSTTGTRRGRSTPSPRPAWTPAWASSASPPSCRGSSRTTTPISSSPSSRRWAARTGKAYGRDPADDVSLRVAADHFRAMTFLIADGVLPGNEGRGYVLRKIMRRAMRHVKHLGVEEPCLSELTRSVVDRMAGAFPELLNHADSVARVVRVEEERFGTTLKQAVAVFTQIAEKIPAGGTVAGSDVFRLYDTYGLPVDFTEELAKERGLGVDTAGFDRELSQQQERARAASKMGTVKGDPVYMKVLEDGGKTEFLGYASLRVEGARVLAVLKNGQIVRRLDAGDEGGLVLDRTPFYAESGGQVGDHGVIASEGSAAQVTDCTAPLPGLYLHHVKVTAGGFERGLTVRAEVDAERRFGGHAPPHGYAPAARGPARDPRPSRQAGGKPGGSRPAALRLQPLRPRLPSRAAPDREPRERGDPEGQRGRGDGHGPRAGPLLRGLGLLRRQVRRAGARGRGPRLLQGVLRGHPRAPHRRDRPLPVHRGAGHRRGNAPRGGPHRPGGGGARPGRPGHPRRAGAGGQGRPGRPGGRVREAQGPAEGSRSGDPGPQDEAGPRRLGAPGRRPRGGGGCPGLDPALRRPRRQGPRRRGRRLPQPEQGPGLRPRVLFGRRRPRARDQRGDPLPHRPGEGPGSHEAPRPQGRGQGPTSPRAEASLPGEVDAMRQEGR